MDRTETAQDAALRDIVEPRRKARRIPLRAAADGAGMSEATWRQLVNGGLTVQGQWVPRRPRRDQVLAMAYAVDVFDEVRKVLKADKAEVNEVKATLNYSPSLAAVEIMRMRHISAAEKIALLDLLDNMRMNGDN